MKFIKYVFEGMMIKKLEDALIVGIVAGIIGILGVGIISGIIWLLILPLLFIYGVHMDFNWRIIGGALYIILIIFFVGVFIARLVEET